MFWTAVILSIIGAALTIFGAWGKYSEAGMRKYDEMAGIIPYFSYYFGIGLLVIAVILWAVLFARR